MANIFVSRDLHGVDNVGSPQSRRRTDASSLPTRDTPCVNLTPLQNPNPGPTTHPRPNHTHQRDSARRRLTHNGQPLIPAPVRQVITERSHRLPLYLDLSVMRFLELRRGGHTPQGRDFDADFPALIARTLADLTPEERSVLRSVALLDAFDLQLATRTAGLPHQSAALRLTERPFVREDPWGLWPFHLHDLIRSTLRNAADHTDDRCRNRAGPAGGRR